MATYFLCRRSVQSLGTIIMKCPHCKQTPISFVKFLASFRVWRIKCAYCNTELKATSSIYVLLICALVVGLLYGILMVQGVSLNLKAIIIRFVVFLIGLFLLGTFAELIAWIFLRYKVYINEENT